MSDPSINISSRGAFSFHWNQGIDSNNSYFIRAGKSFAGLIQAFFKGHTVSLSEAKKESLIQNGKHNNSIFVKECIRKFKAINIEIVNNPVSKKQKNNNENENENENENKENDSNKVKNNHDQQEGFESIGQPLTEKKNKKRPEDVLTADALIKVMTDKDFKSSDDRFSEDNLKLLNPRDCLHLLNIAVLTNSSESHEIAHRLLLTGNCDGLAKATCVEKIDTLILFLVNGNNAAVEYLLDKNIVNINEKDASGRTALHYLVVSNNIACINKLLDYGANTNQFDQEDCTPLHYAAKNGQVECMKLLLLNKVTSADAQRNSGLTPLHFAAMEGNEECLRVLLLHVSTNVVNSRCGKDLMTPLHYAAINGHTGCITMLVAIEDLYIDIKDSSGETALHYVSTKGNEDCLQAILKHPKISINMVDNSGLTPLSKILIKGHLGALNLLLKNMWIDMNLLSCEGLRPLHYAIFSPSEECFKRFLDAAKTKAIKDGELELNLYDSTGNTPIHYVSATNQVGRLKTLLAFTDIKNTVNQRNNDGYAALHLIANDNNPLNDTGCLEELLSVDTINVNVVDDNNDCTLLHWAAEKGNIKVIEILLGVRGIEANKKNQQGKTPMNLLKESGNNYEECKKALQGWTDKGEV